MPTKKRTPEVSPNRRQKQAATLRKLEVAKLANEKPQTLPDWVAETPEEPQIFYELAFWGDHDPDGQRVEITRAEYIRLKATVAELRGFDVPQELFVEAA